MSRDAKPTKAKAKRGPAPRREAVKKGASRRPPLEKRLAEALERQAATSDILRVIRRSRTDMQPVFDMIAERAMRLCGALHGGVVRFDGELVHVAANVAVSPEFLGALSRAYPRPPGRGMAAARAILTGATVHIPDIEDDPDYEFTEAARSAGFRSALAVPMLRDGQAIGAVVVSGGEAAPFSERQVDLLQTFADQAVIAIENVRLFKELEARNRDLVETLEQQTATGEILRVISSSPTGVQPTFEAIAAAAVLLCDADLSGLYRFDGALIHFGAHRGTPEEVEAARQAFPHPPGRRSVTARAILEAANIQIPDAREDPDLAETLHRFRTVMSVPMMREGRPVGAITVARRVVRPFTDKQIALLGTFADQAVIAIENVRLFQELQEKNRALTEAHGQVTEALEQQTATAEILRVISSSPTDIQPVFDTIAESARRLCEGEFCVVFRFDGQLLDFVAHHGINPEGAQLWRRAFPLAPDRTTAAGRAVLVAGVQHIPDVQADPEFGFAEMASAVTFRSIVAVPMMRDGQPVGVLTLARSQTGAFPDRQIDLLKTFADQAVIALENVRLFTELGARNRDLTETLEQQTATSEILRVISNSPTDAQPVFSAIARNAVRLCNAMCGGVFSFDGTLTHFMAGHQFTEDALRQLQNEYPISPRGLNRHAIMDRAVIHVVDVLDDPRVANLEVARRLGNRSQLVVPMLQAGQAIGTINVYGAEPTPFSNAQISLLQTFADQAVIAIENVRLFTELEARNGELRGALEQQTATSELLKVIGRSTFDLQPVFETLAENAVRLCAAERAVIFRFDGQFLRGAASYNVSPELRAFLEQNPQVPGRQSTAGRAALERRTCHIHDVLSDPEYTYGAQKLDLPPRTVLAIPMLRAEELLGVIAIYRDEVLRFTDSQIALMETFADQAAIAIENARLLTELQARTAQLTRSVGELRALGEVSQAVSSTLDLDTVLATIVSRAVELSGSYNGIAYEFDEVTQTFHARATHRVTPELLEAMRAAPIRLGEGAVGRAGVIQEPVEVSDLDDEGQLVAPQTRGSLVQEGVHSLLAVPLVREGRLLGGLVIARRERGAFTREVVATLQTFAAQSVVAIHNARLFREIQRQKQYSDALVETSPVAIVTMDLRGVVVGWNPGAERLFGYAPAEALGAQMEDLIATPERRQEVRANIRQTLEGEWIRAIAQRARKDGTQVDVEISSMPVSVDGAQVGMIGIYHDITELLRARREAEAANEAKGAFLATMSHEIRTPMNAVIGMSGLLLNTALSDEQREYAEVIRQSGDALLTVINDILDFSKIEAGKLELESQPFDVRECVESALDLVATRAAEKGLDLAYLIGDGTPAGIAGDVTRLRQVLLNLLSNAVKFTERGEVVLSVSARRPDANAPLYELTFSVRDTGIGIPPERLGRLFQSFSQVDASTTRRFGGTGLGLAISQRLTELMGSRIGVTSEAGAGSEFRFTIRAAAAEAPVPTRRDLSGVQPSLRGKRVLVVDDNATNRRILTSHLDRWGLQTEATESPLEALAWIGDDERFDVGILDMHMPEMDGVALAQAIRERPAGATLPLILFTSLGCREARAEEAGFAAYLNKPIKPSQLFDALATVLADQPIHVPRPGVARAELDPDMARRHPLRILLAEDNVVNQKVALRLLAQMGYRADLAANGLEAIDAVERQTYDVVLMDVQMPEMDGFEASREINQRWPDVRRPRLVAMTANAMAGDRELCTAAGMDDYVAKPIRVEELVAALERCRWRPDADVGGAPAVAAIDRTVVERLTATMGGPFVAELIDTFAEDARELIATLRRALAETDVDAFRRAAHSLKSNGETLGATELAALARELEVMARAGSLQGAADRIEPLVAGYEAAADALGALRRDLPA